MKKLFLSLVALISCTSLFAQSADEENTSPVFIETEVKYANTYNGEQPSSIQEICDFTITDKNGKNISTGEDVEIGTVLTINFTTFYDYMDYKLISILVNGSEVTLDKDGSYSFTVKDMNTVTVEVAKVLYDYTSVNTFVSLYDGTSDHNLYEFAGVYGNKVYGIPTTKIEAGKPYIVLAGNYIVNFDSSMSAIRDFSGKGYNGFYPSNSNSKKVSGNDYLVINDGKLDYSSTSGTVVSLGKAYFVASEAFKSGSPSVNAKAIMTLDNVTGIGNVSAEDACNAPMYNISGQRVYNATRGLYIVNGKKIAVK